jgi:5'-3' exonuclease
MPISDSNKEYRDQDEKKESIYEDPHSHKDIDTYIKYLKRTFRLNMENIESAKLILRWMGLPIVDAPGEADPQCAAIATEYADSVIGVITDDCDPLMYNSANILKLPNLGSNYVNEYSRAKTLEHVRNKILHIIQSSSDRQITEKYKSIDLADFKITQDNFIEIGCLMGTDFCPSLKVKRILDRSRFESVLELYIRHDMSMDSVLNSMRSRGILSKTYVSRMMCAREAYKTAEIFDPKKMDISFKKPCIRMIRKLCTHVLASDDLEDALLLIDSAYKKYRGLTCTQYPEPVDKFASFASYRDRYAREKSLKGRYGNGYDNHVYNKQFPEPRHRMCISL